jgi:hypothetical protein
MQSTVGGEATVDKRRHWTQNGSMNAFWIIGIVANIVLAGLAAWWVLSSMRSPPRDDPDKRGRD